jgi:phosphatidylglycerophosphate synthase
MRMERRPLASRNLRVFQATARALARAGVSANAISVAGMLFGAAAGAALILTQIDVPRRRVYWVSAAALIQLRLLCNMLDGMVAMERGTSSAVGELYNEIPDRISDSAVLIGLGYAEGGHVVWGYAAALAAMFTAYVRAMGKCAGAPQDFRGPMAKPHRMFLVTVAALFLGLSPESIRTRYPVAAYLLMLITAGSVLTALRRLVRIAGNLRK